MSLIPQAVAKGGRVAVITFNSLEDRIVKREFRKNKNIILKNKKPIVPSEAEILQNKASRSAKLRVIQKL